MSEKRPLAKEKQDKKLKHGLARGLTNYGDADFSLYLRRSFAKAMGEFGAVSVVSGHIDGLTMTMPLRVEKLYNEYSATAAFAVASLLAVLALLTLGLKTLLEWKQAREFRRAQFQISQPLEPVVLKEPGS